MAETHLRGSSPLLDVLFEDPRVGRCLVAPDGSVLRANAEWLRSTGYSLDEVLGEDIVSLFPDTRDMALALHARVRGGHRVEVPLHAQRVRGRETWWDGAIDPVPMAGGIGLLITARESGPGREETERRRAEASLRESEERFRSIFEHAPSGIAICAWDGTFLSCNPAFVALLGRPEEELRRTRFADLIHPDDRAASLSRTRDLKLGLAASFEEESRYLRADGTPVWVHKFVSLLRDGSATPAVLVLVTDVTERRAAERSLRESEARFRAIFERATDAIVLSDPEGGGRVLLANPAACRLFGYGPEEFARLHRNDLLDPGGATQALLDARDRDGQADAVLSYRRKDGARFQGELTSALFADAEGRRRAIAIIRDVTERRAAAESLRRSEEKLRLAKEAARMGAWDWDLLTGEFVWSELCRAIFGRAGEARAPAGGLLAALREEDRAAVAAAIRRAERERAPLDVEARIETLDGSERWVALRGKVFHDGERAVRLAGMALDVTDRRRAEGALRASEANLQAILDATDESVFLFDLEGVALSANRTALARLRRPADQVIGRSIPEVVSAPLAQARMERLREVVDTGRPVEFEDSRAGILFAHTFFPVVGPHGRVDRVAVFSRDVTARRRAEEALRRYELLARLSRDAVLLLRREDGQIVDANPAAERLYGYCRDELLRLTVRDLRAPATAHLAEAQLAEADEDGVLFETEHRRRDGATFPVEVSAQGATVGGAHLVVSVVRDVTARARAEAEVRRAHEALVEADRRKTEFLAVLSHELRNPLAPIRNSIHLLERAPGSDAARRAREVLRRQADHLSRLVDDLLDLTRISHGKIELRLDRLDARDVVRQALADVRGLFDQRGVELLLAEAPAPLWIEADAARLAQMVTNLLGNALKFTPARGQVRVTTAREGDRCEIRVRDTGLGIEPADLERIFEPFVQAERTRRSHGGVGLGLALVRELAGRHGGTVHAESGGAGLGAELVLRLPLVAAPAAAAGAAAPGPAAEALVILVVEDNADAAATLEDLLGLSGHRVTLAGTARAGIEALGTGLPDVLLCDLGLPDAPGHDVVRALRALPGGTAVFAIALSGYAQPQDRADALAAGFDAHLAKPPPLPELEALLAGAAARGRGGA